MAVLRMAAKAVVLVLKTAVSTMRAGVMTAAMMRTVVSCRRGVKEEG